MYVCLLCLWPTLKVGRGVVVEMRKDIKQIEGKLSRFKESQRFKMCRLYNIATLWPLGYFLRDGFCIL